MTNLTTEQLAELHDLTLARLAEFDSVAAHFPKLVPGVVRIVVDVYEEWQAKAYEELCRAEMEKFDPVPRFMPATVLECADPAGTLTFPDPAITAGDIAAFESVWPNIPDLQGEDIFAAEHGEPMGQPEPMPMPSTASFVHIAPEPLRPIGRDRAPDALPTPAAPSTNGNGTHRAVTPRPLSPADAKAQIKAERAAIIAHLQGIAEHGRMPTLTEYHGTRPKHLPMWDTIKARHNVASWEQMAQLCGLAYGKRHTRVVADDHADDDLRPVADDDLDDTDAETDTDADDDLDDTGDEPATDGKRKRPNGTRIKHPRKMGYEYKRPEPETRLMQPTHAELVRFLQGMAMGNVMPTQDQYNLARPAHWSTATAQVTRLHTTWEGLRVEAGLKPNPRWGATWQTPQAGAAA